MVISQLEDTQLSPATHRDVGSPTHQPVEVSATSSTNYSTIFIRYCALAFFPSSVACSRLSLPANVITNTSSNAPGITVNFSCKNGNIVGNSAISCLYNGSWSGSVPYCTSGNSFPSCFTFTAKSLVPD